MDETQRQEMIRLLDEKFSSGAFQGKAVVLFGHCNATERVADYLLARNVVPAAILDNNRAKQGLFYCGIPIVSPDFIQTLFSKRCTVLISTRFFAEMSAQLRSLGYNDDVLQVGQFKSYAAFTEHSVDVQTIKRRVAMVKNGITVLDEIKKQYKDHFLVICPNNALGDVYWMCAYLPEYCKKEGIKLADVAVVLVEEACRQVAEMFGIKNIVALKNSDMDEFLQAVVFTQQSSCMIAHQDLPYTDNIIKWLNRHLLSFVDYYRFAIYALKEDAAPVGPKNIQPFENHVRMPKSKSVILSPYAKSVVSLPSAYWENIADNYKVNGYSVFTNTANSELPVKGTCSLRVPLNQMISAVEYAGTFVGIRSGLCDIVYSADCRKVVVFPDCYYSTTPHKIADFFALPGWETIQV